MALKEKINNDLKAALLSGNRFAGEVLRGLKAAILNEEVAQGKRDLGIDDSSIEQLVAREVKKRGESANIYDNAGRPELADNERAEVEVLLNYLPKQATEDEIKEVIKKNISSFGAVGQSAMGQIIGAVKKELGNTADGALISKLVKSELS